MESNTYKANYIPAEPFLEVFRPLVENFQRSPEQLAHDSNTGAFSHWLWLEQESGVPHRTIFKYLYQDAQFIHFNNADKLLCALGVPHYWWMEPLATYYWNTPLLEKGDPYPRKSRKKTPAGLLAQCCAPGCVNEFDAYSSSGKQKLYCSKKCRDKVSWSRRAA